MSSPSHVESSLLTTLLFSSISQSLDSQQTASADAKVIAFTFDTLFKAKGAACDLDSQTDYYSVRTGPANEMDDLRSNASGVLNWRNKVTGS